MQVKRKAVILAGLPLAALVAGGCGGFQGSHSVSPASLFLPGLIRYDQKPDAPHPAPVQPPAAPENYKEPALIAQVR
jgi:hypothetical protein